MALTTTNNHLVEFMIVDLTAFGDSAYRFVNAGGTSGDAQEYSPVTWDGYEWTPLPFQSTSWKRGGDKPEKPKITIPDFGGLLSITLQQNYNGTGAPITRYNVLDPLGTGPSVYTIERYTLDSYESTSVTLTLHLATQFDYTKAQIPSFVMRRDSYPGLGSGLLR